MQSIIWQDNKVIGKIEIHSALRQDIGEYTLHDSYILDEGNDLIEAPQDPRFKIARILMDFFRRVYDVRSCS